MSPKRHRVEPDLLNCQFQKLPTDIRHFLILLVLLFHPISNAQNDHSNAAPPSGHPQQERLDLISNVDPWESTPPRLHEKIEAFKQYLSSKKPSQASQFLDAILLTPFGFSICESENQVEIDYHELTKKIIDDLPTDEWQLLSRIDSGHAQRALTETKQKRDAIGLVDISHRFSHTKPGLEAMELLQVYFLDRGRYQEASATADRYLKALETYNRKNTEKSPVSIKTVYLIALSFKRSGDPRADEMRKRFLKMWHEQKDSKFGFSLETLENELDRQASPVVKHSLIDLSDSLPMWRLNRSYLLRHLPFSQHQQHEKFGPILMKMFDSNAECTTEALVVKYFIGESGTKILQLYQMQYHMQKLENSEDDSEFARAYQFLRTHGGSISKQGIVRALGIKQLRELALIDAKRVTDKQSLVAPIIKIIGGELSTRERGLALDLVPELPREAKLADALLASVSQELPDWLLEKNMKALSGYLTQILPTVSDWANSDDPFKQKRALEIFSEFQYLPGIHSFLGKLGTHEDALSSLYFHLGYGYYNNVRARFLSHPNRNIRLRSSKFVIPESSPEYEQAALAQLKSESDPEIRLNLTRALRKNAKKHHQADYLFVLRENLKSPLEDLRIESAIQLAHQGDDTGLEIVLDAIENKYNYLGDDPDALDPAQVIKKLGNRKGVVERLITIVRKGNTHPQILEALATIAPASYRIKLAKELLDTNRSSGVLLLTNLEKPDMSPLLRLYREKSWSRETLFPFMRQHLSEDELMPYIRNGLKRDILGQDIVQILAQKPLSQQRMIELLPNVIVRLNQQFPADISGFVQAAGEPGIASLLNTAFSDPEPRVRRNAWYMLSKLKEKNPVALKKALQETVNKRQGELDFAPLRLLWELGDKRPEYLARLQKKMMNGYSWEVENELEVLGISAIPVYRAGLKSANSSVRDAATKYAINLLPAGQERESLFLSALEDPNWGIVQSAIKTLNKRPQALSIAALKPLLKALESNPKLTGEVLKAVVAIEHPDAQATALNLVKAHPHLMSEVTAESTLVQPSLIGRLYAKAPASHRPAILRKMKYSNLTAESIGQALVDADPNTRGSAASRLVDSTDPGQFIPQLSRAFLDSEINLETKQDLLRAIVRANPTPAQGMPVYLAALRSNDPRQREIALYSISNFGERAQPYLERAAKNADVMTLQHLKLIQEKFFVRNNTSQEDGD